MISSSPYFISVAPMMDYTDRHCRYFLRLLAPSVRLYTEMITSHALQHGDFKHLLQFSQEEHPIALQLGGSDPHDLAHAATLGEAAGYDEINLNVGCPSDRVQSGRFGACLMLEPKLVAECVAAMKAVVSLPVTVKCRLGVDNADSYEALHSFISTVSKAGCHVFIIHARKAWLKGLSPKENREIPPLCYDVVYRVKKDFPHLTIVINGGIKTQNDVNTHLQQVDGVMLGRAACSNPYLLAELTDHTSSRAEMVEAFLPYIESELSKNTKLASMTRHMLGLFQGERGAGIWRRYLSEHAHKKNAGVEVVREALRLVFCRVD